MLNTLSDSSGDLDAFESGLDHGRRLSTPNTGARRTLIKSQGTLKPPTAPIGCGIGSNTRTVVVAGNFEGDSTRFDVVLKHSTPIARKAAAKYNRVSYAFLGNVVPDVHPARGTGEQTNAADDSLTRIVRMAVDDGIDLGDGHRVAADDVLLLVGGRELAWLRLANQSPEAREVARFDAPGAADALRRPTPFATAVQRLRPSWHEHNCALKRLPAVLEGDALAVAMMLKLVSMAQLTMHAPGLVHAFAGRLGPGDEVAQKALRSFLASQDYDGTIETGMAKLLNGSEPTIEGLGIAPAAKQLVDAVLRYAEVDLHAYLSKAQLLHCVENGESSAEGEHALWVTPSGTMGGEIVNHMPDSVDPRTLRVKWKPASAQSRTAWAEGLNTLWSTWYKTFSKGDYREKTYEVWIALSLDFASPLSHHHNTLPIKGLNASEQQCCSGATACASVPFGTIQRRICVNATDEGDDLDRVLDAWTNINTDAFTPSTYWSVATWCGGTKRALSAPWPDVDLTEPLSEHLYQVSVTLAALLSTPVGGSKKTVAAYGWEGINGVLGPIVVPQTEHKQPMRLVSLTHDSIDEAFVALLPEAFVRYSCSDYAHHYEELGSGSPALASEGFLALPDEAHVEIVTHGRTEPENATLRERMGQRLWALTRKRNGRVISPFATEDYAAIQAMQASKESKAVERITGFTLMHTRQTGDDPFAGLNIALAPVGGYRSRMTIDTDVTNYHALFRVVSS
tara:strand:+ start:8008 stop:10218 length:2211 start_codon:yes stop_codon:yes gene_type:complete